MTATATRTLADLDLFLTGQVRSGYVGPVVHELFIVASAWMAADVETKYAAVDAASAEFGISIDSILRFIGAK